MREIFVKLVEKHDIRRRGDSTKLIIDLLGELPRYGYGIPEPQFIDEKHGAAKIRIRNCFNTLGYKDSKKPVCYRMEGILASLFETVFERRVTCREIKCSSMGEPYCEFHIFSFNVPSKVRKEYPRPPTKGLVPVEVDFYPDKGEIIHSGINSTFFPRSDIKYLETESESIIGPATKEIWYMIGRIDTKESVGRNIPRSIGMKIMARLSKSRFAEKVRDIGTRRGYGITEYKLDMKKKTASVEIHNSVNAYGFKGSKKPVCYLTAGTIAAACEIIFGRVMRCEEVKCIAKGDSCCEFRVHPESE
jgi:predicted hydrocarbon binding protein